MNAQLLLLALICTCTGMLSCKIGNISLDTNGNASVTLGTDTSDDLGNNPDGNTSADVSADPPFSCAGQPFTATASNGQVELGDTTYTPDGLVRVADLSGDAAAQGFCLQVLPETPELGSDYETLTYAWHISGDRPFIGTATLTFSYPPDSIGREIAVLCGDSSDALSAQKVTAVDRGAGTVTIQRNPYGICTVAGYSPLFLLEDESGDRAAFRSSSFCEGEREITALTDNALALRCGTTIYRSTPGRPYVFPLIQATQLQSLGTREKWLSMRAGVNGDILLFSSSRDGSLGVLVRRVQKNTTHANPVITVFSEQPIALPTNSREIALSGSGSRLLVTYMAPLGLGTVTKVALSTDGGSTWNYSKQPVRNVHSAPLSAISISGDLIVGGLGSDYGSPGTLWLGTDSSFQSWTPPVRPFTYAEIEHPLLSASPDSRTAVVLAQINNGASDVFTLSFNGGKNFVEQPRPSFDVSTTHGLWVDNAGIVWAIAKKRHGERFSLYRSNRGAAFVETATDLAAIDSTAQDADGALWAVGTFGLVRLAK